MRVNILYADDEPYFIEAIVSALRDEGFHVDIVMNGSDAITFLEKNSPDIIIMDTIMPTGEKVIDGAGGRRTGLRCLEIIRKQMGLRIPVVFVTVVDDSQAQGAILEIEKSFGMENKSAILVKPVYPTEVIETVNGILGKN